MLKVAVTVEILDWTAGAFELSEKAVGIVEVLEQTTYIFKVLGGKR